MSYFTHINDKYTEVKNIDDVLDNLKYLYDEQESKIKSLQRKNQELVDEKWKDKKLLEMQQELVRVREDASRGFPISEEEFEKIKKWEDQHWTNQHNAPDFESRLKKMGPIGGAYEYRFIPTSIGVIGTVYCPSCLNKARMQAYDEYYHRFDNNDEKQQGKFNFNKRFRELAHEYDAEFNVQKI